MPAYKTDKDTLLVRAMQVFRSQGYHASSMADLAAACGVQKAHLYYYFPGGKEDLMNHVLEAVHTYFKERIMVYAWDEERSPEERLAQLSAQLYKVFVRNQGGCIMGNTTLEVAHLDPAPVFVARVKAYFDDMLACLAHVFAQRHAPELARTKAQTAIQDIQGGIMLMQLYNDPSFFAAALQRMQEAY
ncbi:MAG: helix-turn-helix domain-containing protein [Bacteroidia bacterium]|nr:helix-turn-helix domain-containing protein [Bacteroidia bacterium]